MYHIRRVDPEDFDDEIMSMQRLTLPLSPPLPFEDAGDWWIAFFGDAPIGFASLSASNKYHHSGYLSRAGVLPAHGGHGLQKRLIRARERRARTYGWQMLVTDTWYKNPASQRSLIACGYKPFIPEEPWSFEHSIYWKKDLTVRG